MRFREYHLLAVLKRLELQKGALDSILNSYFRSHRALGSKDRRFISETIYSFIRWKNLFQYLHLPPSEHPPSPHDPTIPPHIRHGMPQELYTLLTAAYGEPKTQEISLICNSRAPCTIRINPLKTSQQSMLERLASYGQVSRCQFSPLGIHLHQRINTHALPEFKNGFFEIQDEASQLTAQLVHPFPQQHLLDFCAGSGGKTLAFAHLLPPPSQIYLHDTRPHMLNLAQNRLRRAGIGNVQFTLPEQKGSMDWVVVDAPCTGTGTLRRSPDLKWKFNMPTLRHLIAQQRAIFTEALSYLRPSGHIVYITCSLLPQENETQVAFFQKEFGLTVTNSFITLPQLNGMDGFYGVCLKKSNLC